jgi:hypothetical protein
LYVRVEDNTTACIGINEVSFIKNSTYVPITTEVSMDVQCDGSEDDSKGLFNLHNAEALVAPLLSGGTYKFYRNEDDAKNAFKDEASGIFNSITEPEVSSYINRDLYKEGLHTVDELYVRVKDSAGNFCDDIAKIKLYVYPYIRLQDDNPVICEYEPEGVKTKVDLWSSVRPMLSPNGNDARIDEFLEDMRVIFEYSGVEIGRVEDVSQLIPTSITEYVPQPGVSPVTITVTFENKIHGCSNHAMIQITQKPTPRPELDPQFICDEDMNGEYDDLLLKDLDQKLADKGGLNLSDTSKYEITYHKGYQKALDDLDAIDKNSYFPLSDDIFIKVKDRNTECIGIIKIEFETNDPLALADTELYACDSDNDEYADFEARAYRLRGLF